MNKDIHNILSTEEEASRIIDALMSDDLSYGLEEEIRSWLSLPTHSSEKDLAIEKSFHEYVQPDLNPDQAVRKSFDEVCLKLGLDCPASTGGAVRKFRKTPLRTRLAYWSAVAAVLLVAAGVWWFEGADLTDEGGQIALTATSITYSSADEVKQIVLPDSTMVVLNEYSSITYESRGEVILIGEAYFEVARNEKVPFVVSSPNLTITVLGTCFQMSDRTDEKESLVKLYSGKISLTAGNIQCEIVPGEWIQLDRQSNTISYGVIGAETKPRWADTRIFSLEFASFEDILQALSSHFDVTLRNDRPELNSEIYSVTFRGDESLEEVISILQLASNKFNYRIVDNTLIIE